MWRCLSCKGVLSAEGDRLTCSACGKAYPIISGIPLLVREPADYLRSERSALVGAARRARLRAELIGTVAPYAGLPEAVLARHRDVNLAEAGQAETLLALIEAFPGADGETGARRQGWSFDTLTPYLLRDWTGAAELQTMGARLAAALGRVFPDPTGKSLVFAGCGAGGLLAEIGRDFAEVAGFDLTLPILAAARRLLDGGEIDLPLAKILNEQGRAILRRPGAISGKPPAKLAAMDALDTAFADRSVDCMVTVFLTDILPDPTLLADEIRRVLKDDGVWINFGPSGNNPTALWRFDQAEAAAFFMAAGFTILEAEAARGTVQDFSATCPPVSYRSAMCYLTVTRKAERPAARQAAPAFPSLEDLPAVVLRHFPGARLVQTLEAHGFVLQHDRVPGRSEHWDLGGRAARIMTLVDGKRTAGEIADILNQRKPPQPVEETLDAIGRFLRQGLLSWRSDEG